MSIESALREEFDRGERREVVFYTILPYTLLAVATLITLMQWGLGDTLNFTAIVILTTAVTAWLIWLTVLGPKRRGSDRLMGLHYAGLLALIAGLVVFAPWYGIFGFVGFVHALLFLNGRWRYVGVVVTSMIMSVSYMGGLDQIGPEDWWLWGAISLVTIVVAATFFYFAETADEHGRKKKRALAELHEANLRLEETLAENAGLHNQLLIQAREAGVLDERQRMARDIHDTLAQSLAGILTQLQAAEQTMGAPLAAHRHMTNAMNLARESLTEARRTVYGIGPELLADSRLPDAVDDVTRGWAEANRIDATLTTTGDPRPLHADVEVALLRAAQEGLANVTKHAKASRVGLTLSYMDDMVTLDIRDDGVGFEPDAQRASGSAKGGFGLAGMRQRVQRLAGRLNIESEPGGGTAISACIPAIPAGGAR